MASVFNTIDRNHDGVISRAEFAGAMAGSAMGTRTVVSGMPGQYMAGGQTVVMGGGQIMSEPVQTMQPQYQTTTMQPQYQTMQAPIQTQYIQQAPVQTVQAVQQQMPMTYAAPVSTTYGSPAVNMSASMRPGAAQMMTYQPGSVQIPQAATSIQMQPMAQTGMRVVQNNTLALQGYQSPAALLGAGQLISEYQVSEDELRASGNLITDTAAEAKMNARFQQLQEKLAVLPAPQTYGAPPQYQMSQATGFSSHAGQIHGHQAVQQEARPTDCQWMFADAATGWLGIHALAHLNPMRWSGAISLDKGIQDLNDVGAHENRPILVKVPAHSHHEQEFADPQQAAEYIWQMAQN